MYLYENKIYILSPAEYENSPHFVVSFRDIAGIKQEITVDEAIYMTLLHHNRIERNCQRWDERHVEQNELTEQKLHERSFRKQKSVEQIVMDKLRDEQLWLAIDKLNEVQKRRTILYYFYELTYEKIAWFELKSGITPQKCSPQAVKASIDAAIKNLRKLLRNRL